MADLRPHSLLTSRLGIMDKSLYGRGGVNRLLELLEGYMGWIDEWIYYILWRYFSLLGSLHYSWLEVG
nr:hypothetical protein Q903MT_gene170 [Picea sitchensis]